MGWGVVRSCLGVNRINFHIIFDGFYIFFRPINRKTRKNIKTDKNTSPLKGPKKHQQQKQEHPSVPLGKWIHQAAVLLLLGGIFNIFLSGFAIDRSKKYIKTIKIYIKIDAVNHQAAADNHPPPPGQKHYIKFDAVNPQAAADPNPQSQRLGVWNPTTPKTPSNSAASWNVDACSILPQTPLPRSPRARSTRSIGDPLGLDRLDRSGIP